MFISVETEKKGEKNEIRSIICIAAPKIVHYDFPITIPRPSLMCSQLPSFEALYQTFTEVLCKLPPA